MKSSIDAMKQELRELHVLTGKWVFDVVSHSEDEQSQIRSRISELNEAIQREEAQSVGPFDTCLSNCDTCRYSEAAMVPDGEAHCYMFRDEPVGVCAKWEGSPAKQPLPVEREALINRMPQVNLNSSHSEIMELMCWANEAADMLAADAQTILAGYALVPIKMTPAMNDIADRDDWQWADLLAAAEAITEDQYNDAQAQQVTVPQEDSVRYCYECGSIGEAPKGKRDCCPDGSHARYVNRVIAEQAQGGFNSMLSAAPQPPQTELPKTCIWTEKEGGCYDTGCGEYYMLNDGTPAQNGAVYCHHCGNKIEVKP